MMRSNCFFMVLCSFQFSFIFCFFILQSKRLALQLNRLQLARFASFAYKDPGIPEMVYRNLLCST